MLKCGKKKMRFLSVCLWIVFTFSTFANAVAADYKATGERDESVTDISADALNVAANESDEYVTDTYADGEEAAINGTPYATLQDAIDNALEGQEIDLLTNVEVDRAISVGSDKNIILDLNGYDINRIMSYGPTISNTGNLEIKDKNENSGTITNVESSGTVYETIENSGTIVVTGGIITCLTYGYAVSNNFGAELTIKGGTIEGGSYGIWSASETTVTISGGTITGDCGISNAGTTVISGGTVKGTTVAISNGGYASIGSISDAELTIEGGTIEGGDYGIANYTDVTISGGTIAGDYGIFNGGTVLINGGRVKGTTYAIANNVFNSNRGWSKLIVEGGSIMGIGEGIINYGYTIITKEATITESGIGIHNGGTLTVETGIISENTTGIYNQSDGTIIIEDGEGITENETGIENEGILNIEDSSLRGNDTGIYNKGTATIKNSTIDSTKIGIENHATLMVESGTITGGHNGIINDGTLTLGYEGGIPSVTSPRVVGGQCGIQNSGTFYFYDGRVVVDGEISNDTSTFGPQIQGVIIETPKGYSPTRVQDDSSATKDENGIAVVLLPTEKETQPTATPPTATTTPPIATTTPPTETATPPIATATPPIATATPPTATTTPPIATTPPTETATPPIATTTPPTETATPPMQTNNPSVVTIPWEQQEENNNSINAKLKVDQTGGKIGVSWGEVKGADGYMAYIQYCKKKFSSKPTKTVKSANVTQITVTKINGKKLNLKKNYKVYVVAYRLINGEKILFGKTITAHIVGKNNHAYTNVKQVRVSKSKYILKVGKTAKIKAKTVLVDKTKKQLSNAHAKEFRYKSTDTSVAKVSAGGKITAKGKGTCAIYVYARNGYAKKIGITVK